jgi:hypothetical protein
MVEDGCLWFSGNSPDNKATYIGQYTTRRGSNLSRAGPLRVSSVVVVSSQRCKEIDGFAADCIRQPTAFAVDSVLRPGTDTVSLNSRD